MNLDDEEFIPFEPPVKPFDKTDYSMLWPEQAKKNKAWYFDTNKVGSLIATIILVTLTICACIIITAFTWKLATR